MTYARMRRTTSIPRVRPTMRGVQLVLLLVMTPVNTMEEYLVFVNRSEELAQTIIMITLYHQNQINTKINK